MQLMSSTRSLIQGTSEERKYIVRELERERRKRGCRVQNAGLLAQDRKDDDVVVRLAGWGTVLSV